VTSNNSTDYVQVIGVDLSPIQPVMYEQLSLYLVSLAQDPELILSKDPTQPKL